MNNNAVFLAGLAVVIVVGASAYVLMGKSDAPATPTTSETAVVQTPERTTKPVGTTEPSSVKSEKSGTYVPFSPQALGQAAATERVLFFYASWCPTCKPADADFSQNTNQIPEGVTVIRVNYNDPDTDQAEKDLAKKYAVTYQHTYVQIDADGNEVTKWNGGKLTELVAKMK